MKWNDPSSVGSRLSDILADNRILPSDWKYFIPFYIVQQPITIAINAKNLADGINEAIELYAIDIPPNKLVSGRYDQKYLID